MHALSKRALTALLGIFCCAGGSLFALDIKGIDYMSITELARTCGMRYRTVVKGKIQKVYNKTAGMAFEVNSRRTILNGRTIYLGHPAALHKGALHIARRDFKKTISPVLYPQKSETPPRLFHIVVDAGHGGKDKGAQNKKYRVSEKSVTLDIASRLGKELKKDGYKVSYTRTSDHFVELEDRSKAANEEKADMFLSVHCNAASAHVSGLETFALTPRWMPSTSAGKISKSDAKDYNGNIYDDWSQLLAYYIQDSLVRATGAEDRGVKRARFAVLRDVKMPAALVECGFISNNGDCAKLLNPSYRQQLAQGVAQAVIRYHNTLRRLHSKKPAASKPPRPAKRAYTKKG